MRKFKRTIEFIKDQRISTSHTKKFRGVRDTLVGWSLIAVSAVFFQPPYKTIDLQLNFIIFFLSAVVSLFLYIVLDNLISGNRLFHNLWIVRDTETGISESHLTIKQRIKWIYFRGLVATGGYICFSLAKIAFGVVDNTSIFGADAIVYAVFAYLLLKDKFTLYHWFGLLIAGTGVFYVLFYDIQGFTVFDGLVAGTSGVVSAIALTVIFFITGIIVRHDTPKRVAFHQCICGLGLSIAILLVTLLFRKIIKSGVDFSTIDSSLVKNSILSGVLYAIAMVFFLRAFLFTQPIIIAILGYSLNLFVVVLQSWQQGAFPSGRDVVSSSLILIGCCFPIFYEYKKEKKTSRSLNKLKPIYEKDLRADLISLREKYQTGLIDKYHYLSEHHEFNKLLLEFSGVVKKTIINEIKIDRETVVFSVGEFEIKMETDGGARSAPLEILSFGAYEPEDEAVIFSLLKDGDTIFDIGAHIGWYTLNFAKRYPNSQVYAFEPVPMTYEVLVSNVNRNAIKNANLFNKGLFADEKNAPLVYFKGGSALASMTNLINHEKTKLVDCKFTTLDRFINEQRCSIDFIKCDVEGAELYVLLGGQQVIAKHQPIIFMEIYEEWCKKNGYEPTDILDLLIQLGYDIFQSKNNSLVHCHHLGSNSDEKYNYFFLHKDKHSKIIRGL